MVFGTFDLLHDGHRHLFQEAKQYGDHLIVVVARDSTVLKVKGREAMYTEEERRQQVAEEEVVDLAIIGHEEDKYQVIEEHKPKVLVLGYDQTHFLDRLVPELEARELKVSIRRASSLRPEELKSTLLKTQL